MSAHPTTLAWMFSLAALLCLLPAGRVFGEVVNLCPNGGFEDGDANQPAHWINNGNGSWSTAQPHSGARCLALDLDKPVTRSWTSDAIALEPGMDQLSLSVWARWEDLSGGTAMAVLYHLDGDGQRIGQSASMAIGGSSEPSSGGQWRQFSAISSLAREVKAVQVNLRLYNAAGKVWFDDVQLTPLDNKPILTAAPLRRGLDLKDGVTIVRGSEGQAATDRIAAALRDAGVKVDIVEHHAADLMQLKHDAILVGNLVTNDACAYLYHHSYTYEDRYYPGIGGYVLRPLINPLGTGANFCVVGASDERGFDRAADVLLPLLSIAEAPDVPLTVSTGENYQGYLSHPWKRYRPWRELNETVLYLTTGDRAYAEKYRRFVLDNWFKDDKQPEGAWGHLFYITRTLSWDLMHTCDVFSDEERLRITNELLAHLRGDQGIGYISMRQDMVLRENHATRAARALYFGWRFFNKYYRGELDADLRLWRRTLETFWKANFASSRSYEDSLSQHALGGSMVNTLDIGFMEPGWSADFFGSGRARLMGERSLAIINNQGDTVMLGGTASGDYPASIFAMLSYKLRDGRYLFALNKRGLKSSSTDEPLRGWAADIQPLEPIDVLGVQIVPGDDLYFRSALTRTHGVTAEEGFDKIAFRSGWDADDDYLMLDGVGGGSHSFDDCNSIGEFSCNGRRWLLSPDSLRGPALSFHNAVTVARDGLGPLAVGEAARLLRVGRGDGFAYTATQLPDHHGVDWNRHIMHRPGGFFFVVDELAAREPGDYTFVAGWRSRGAASLEPGLFRAAQDGELKDGVELDAKQLAQLLQRHSDLPFYFFTEFNALQIYTEAAGQGATVPIDVPATGGYHLMVTTFDNSGDRGIMSLSIDGQPVGVQIDQLNPNGMKMTRHDLGALNLTAGAHLLRFEAAGKNAASSNYLLGLQSVQLIPTAATAAPRIEPNRFFMHFPQDTGATLDFDRELLGPKLPSSPYSPQVLNILEQSRDSKMDPGDVVCFQNLFYGRTGSELPRYELRRLDEHCALVRDGEGVALIGASANPIRVDLGGVVVEGRAFYLSADEQHLVDAKVEAAGSIGDALRAAWHRAESRQAEHTTAWRGAPAATVLWNQALPAQLRSVAADGDRVAMGLDDGSIILTDDRGTPVGTFTTGGPVHALLFADLNGDGVNELLAGSDDQYLYVFDRTLAERWRHRFDFMAGNQPHPWWTLGAAQVRALHVADITGDGKPEIFAGVGNMHVYCLTNTGEELWHTRTEHGVPNVLTSAKLTGDVNPKLIVANGIFSGGGYAAVVDDQGRFLQHFRMGGWAIACPAVAVGDIDHDGVNEVFVGSNLGDVRAFHAVDSKPAGNWNRSPAAKVLWETNLSRVVRTLSIFPGPSQDLLVAGSDSGYLIAFNPAGERVWGMALSGAILFTDTIDDGRLLVAGCKDGHVFAVDDTGKIVAAQKLDGQLVGLSVDRQSRQVFAATMRPDAVVSLRFAGDGGE